MMLPNLSQGGTRRYNRGMGLRFLCLVCSALGLAGCSFDRAGVAALAREAGRDRPRVVDGRYVESPLPQADTYPGPDLGPCGKQGLTCCATDPACATGLVCDATGTCAACGDSAELCCATAPVCNGQLVCTGAAGTCVSVACGGPGQACCATAPACSQSGLTCNTGKNTCETPACGGSGQACCPGDTCKGKVVCKGSTCVACGDASQPCCAGNTCSTTKLVCSGSTCQTCGGVNQPCCPGRTCSGASLSCVGGAVGQCSSCGGESQACCTGGLCLAPYTVCGGTKICQPCGRASGDPCCPNDVCEWSSCNHGQQKCK